MANPYENLPAEKFWRSGVADRDLADGFEAIWQPKFKIATETPVLTAGSCFAQHISRWMIANGYGWREAEAPPADLPATAREDNGYGVFSFRTGNIYTAALLRQWVSMALGKAPQVNEIFEDDGRFYDPLRPTIPAAGFDSAQEVLDARHRTLQAMRETFSDAGLFVFTLGLTEGWQHRDGYVYPLCPGTVRGQFDANTVSFFNQAHDEVRADLNASFDMLAEINPQLRFLLTVSPVPLTATASTDHVLVATTNAKAVLRSVAGELARARSDVDYFPSYELIASHPMRAAFFADNLRSVKPEGVAHVMRHFEACLNGASPAKATASAAKPTVASNMAAQPSKDAEDVFCEDILMETWNPAAHRGQPARLCLIGDSHMGHLSSSLSRLDVPHFGGMIMNGSAWTSNLIHPDADEFFVPLEDARARDRWRKTLEFFSLPTTTDEGPRTVLSNIGQQTHRSVNGLVGWATNNNVANFDNKAFDNYFLTQNRDKLVALKQFVNLGYRVLIITDPPFQAQVAALRVELWEMYEKLSARTYRSLGCEVFDARDFVARIGTRPEFYSNVTYADGTPDWSHGSQAYYDTLAAELIQHYGLAEPAALPVATS